MTGRAVSTQATEQINQVRFRNLLYGAIHERAVYDQVILETHDCVVAPTLGSIVPNWLLILPRRHAVNFRDWQAVTSLNPVWLVGEILAKLGIGRERAIWFEHGPSADGSLIGCGVDHAHLHLLVDAPFSFEQFSTFAAECTHLNWRHISAPQAYDSISGRCSYLVGGRLGEAVLAEDVESVGSQFFRRIVAQLADKPDQWDYKGHPHLENVLKTIASITTGEHQRYLRD